MASAYGSLNGSGPQQIYINCWLVSQTGNQSNYRCQLSYIGNGYGSFTYQTQYWSVSGPTYREGTFTVPEPGTGNILLADFTFSRTHNSSGVGTSFTITGSIDTNHSSIGDGSVSVNPGTPPRIPKVPGKPAAPVFVSAETTAINYTFASPSDNGGSSITNYNHQSATNSAFTTGVLNWNDTGSPGKAATLVPGTPHWIRFRAVNAIGTGAWSDALQATTLPAVPPGMTVTASPSGTAATVTFTPPGGVTGVRQYDWERRIAGTTTPVATGSTTTTVAEVSGLIPGTRYEWRGSAWIDQYQSPWTGWQALTQPKPNTSPGDYFDGSTADTPDVDYSWSGTANASTSIGTASGVDGWSATVVGGSAVLMRATAGAPGAGTYAARVVFHADATGPEGWFGMTNVEGKRAEVTAGATYYGSIHVSMENRAQRLAAKIIWLTGAGAIISASTGTSHLVEVAGWTRLVTSGVAPATAEYAIVVASDVAGTGWALWQGGDVLLLDGAMLSLNEEFPYFDGDSTDDDTYVYEWEGATNASPSTRTPTGAAVAAGALDAPNLLAGCTVPPKPPRPPSIPSDCITEVGVWRRYYVEIPSINISDWLSGVLTLNVATGAFAANQVRIRVYPNPFNYDPSQINTNEWCAEQIVSYLPASTVLTLDGVTQRAWAEVNGGSAQSADHLLYGTGGTPATWPILSCGISYLVSLEVPINAPEGNIDVEAFITTRT
jgi:hypothetical protein